MLITDKEKLGAYASDKRQWQGIPTVAITGKGRIFAAFYSGMDTERLGNFSVLAESKDGGMTFSEPIAAVDVGKNQRAYDNCLWIDPDGRLWYIWAVMPKNHIEYAICEKPDAEKLVFGDIHTIESDVMMNKPTVTENGRWLFPCAVWKEGLIAGSAGGSDGLRETGAHVFETKDKGQTFEKIGTVIAPERSFDEHQLFEKKNGDIEMYIRTNYGIAKSVSHDGGFTWDEPKDSGIKGPCSRFYIGRLKSGRVLLVNHTDFSGRNNMTALLSEDDGNTFPYKLLLDERNEVSYPDACEKDGFIYIVYDRERGARYEKDKDYSYSASEILMAKITEEDITSGHLTNSESRVKISVSRLN